MSVNCEAYIGFTVNIAENLSHDEFETFDEYNMQYPEYNRYNHNFKSRVRLIVDGMNGFYARLVYIDKFIDEISMGFANHYSKLRAVPVPDDVYRDLNTAYEKLMHKKLDKGDVEYAFWLHFT